LGSTPDGRLVQGRGDPDAAERLYERAFRLDPKNYSARANALLVRIGKNDWTAIPALLQALDELAV
jgi:tetratricopeptide (TPR) repeat protein